MTKFAILLLTFFSWMQISFAQSSIQGTLKDDAGKGVSGAAISVMNAADSALLTYDISDDRGYFDIAVADTGKVFLVINMIGFQSYGSQPVSLHGSSTTLPDIKLMRSNGQLKDVAVVARKPLVEVKDGKMVLNVENSINATGSNAMELLRKSPGVLVDQNDNITVKGKTGVKIYIDGKMSQLDAKDLAAYLRSINSNDIESIEFITNPGAKYDAAGNAGIINIKLKKNKNFGTNGSVSLTGIEGITPKSNGSVNLNYRNKKVNIFGNIGGDVGRQENGMYLNRTQLDTNYVQNSVNRTNGQSMNLKTGMDYFINNENTVGVLLTSNIGNNELHTTSNTNIYDPYGDFTKKLVAYNTIPGSTTNNNINLNYRFADTAGHELNVDADYGLFRGRGYSTQPNYYQDVLGNPLATIINNSYTPTNIDIYTFKADYEQKLGPGKLGFGAKTAYVRTFNTFDFYDVINNTPVEDVTQSNQFRYTENVNAAYVNYSTQLTKKVSLVAGVRYENTQSTGALTRADGIPQPDDTVKKHYSDLFPSAALSWNMNATNAFNLTYSRRIDRPTYQDLNPFEFKLDELTFQKGNAFLAPQYTDVVELTHTYKSMISSTLSYSYVHDFATQVTDTQGNASYVQQRNLSTDQILSAAIGAPVNLTKWWNSYYNLSYIEQIFNGVIGANPVFEMIPTFNAYTQQTFILGKNTTAEISGNYSSKSVWGITWHTQPQGGLDLGLQQSFWNKRANLKISFTDIFYTEPWKAASNFGGLNVVGSGYWESRTARVSFTYKFGSNQVSKARDHHSGMEAEGSRIKNK